MAQHGLQGWPRKKRRGICDDGRESLAHMLMFPEHGIAGFIYPTVLSNSHAKGRAHLFGPGLPEPVQEEIDGPVPDTLDFDDWHTGSLRMAVRKPNQSVDLAWQGTRIQFEGHFEAKHPP